MERLIALLRRLRGPDGCPWDQAQTSQSLAPFLLEETYELLDAISQGDDGGIREELGDVLLHIAFQAELAEERGTFSLDDVVRHIVAKIASRHNHILEGCRRDDGATWETNKLKERGGSSIMEGIPRSLPALLRAWRCQQRAAEVGFDWPTPEARWAKVREEVAELEEAVRRGHQEHVAAELGDLLFSLVSYGRHMGLVAEDTLHDAVRRFSTRFGQMERFLSQRGIPIAAAGLVEMEAAWEEVKASERDVSAGYSEDSP
jgi:MazG family protein